MDKAGQIFLEQVIEKLKSRIKEAKDAIFAGQKDVESMHEYYWENYAEMDEYGYEIYDNQQALLSQVNANQEQLLKKRKFEKMLDAPFFGRVDFIYEGEEEAEAFYIGIGNFAERAGSVPLIYDWRAPVSGLFYDYDKGPAAYIAPGGLMEGEISSKWQYKIRDGRMIYGFESDMKIDDEILKQELGSGGDVQLKNIVRTIQKEQNAIIRNTKDKIMVIQGAAGSGKTSVALHRIAYLLYHDREHLRSSDILILSPNSVFADYISHILPELGEENIMEMSFDIFAYKELRGVVDDCEDRYDFIEKRLKRTDEAFVKRYKEKQSKMFTGLVEGFLAGLEDSLLDFTDVEYKGFGKSEQELIELFYFRFQDTPVLSRMEAVMEYFIDEYETLKGRTISGEEREFLQEKFMRMYVTRDVYTIYNWFLSEAGYEELPDVPLERRRLSYEDVFPMLYLKYRLEGKKNRRNMKHVVVDEMQDYTYLQYILLKELFSCNMTILGDRAQSVDDEMQDVLRFLPGIFGKQIRRIEMNKSYRNTVEIAEYAAKIIGLRGLELFCRHGKAVEEKRIKDFSQAAEEITKNYTPEKYETAAVITMTEGEAKAVYKRLWERNLNVSYIDRNSFAFKKGLTVTTFYLAKGLEFDQVFMLSGKAEDAFAKQAKYIGATRALHELYIYPFA